jgi:hypothetical protein
MAVEECLMDAVLHQLAARHPGGRGSHCPSGPEASGRCDGRDFCAQLCWTPGISAAALATPGLPDTPHRYAPAGFGRSCVHEG